MDEQARLETENETLRFECELLRRETSRLIVANRTLEASLALAERERERVRHILRAMEGSRSWRLLQAMRGWVGRRW